MSKPNPPNVLLPGVARRDRARSPGLVRWLRAAQRDPEAIEATALAFADLPRPARLQLVRPLLRDVQSAFGEHAEEGARLIALILAIESDDEVANALCRALGELTLVGSAELPAEAWLGGDDDDGCAALRLPGAGMLHMSWRGGIGVQLRLFHVPVDSPEDAGAEATALRPASVGEAVQLMSAPLLRYRRAGGTLPEGAAVFARLF